jgi:hypothetical protein
MTTLIEINLNGKVVEPGNKVVAAQLNEDSGFGRDRGGQ